MGGLVLSNFKWAGDADVFEECVSSYTVTPNPVCKYSYTYVIIHPCAMYTYLPR